MEKKCESCNSCGMVFQKPSDHALGREDIEYCVYCTDSNGKLKSYADVFGGMVGYLEHSQGLDRNAAENMAEEVLLKLPAWKTRGKENDTSDHY